MDSVQLCGQSYNNTNISGDARAHLGNVFNFSSTDSEEQDILDWLATLNPSASHDHACNQYQEGTLGWIFDHATFRNWRDRPNTLLPQALWCRGGLGTGKTTMVARILNHLQERGNPRGTLAVVYCQYAQRNILTVETVMGSILAQLYQHSERGFEIPAHIKAASKSQPRFWKRRPSLEQLKTWLRLRLEDEKPVFVLVDAVDELNPKLRRKLLHSMQSMSQLKLLVTSRDASGLETGVFEKQEIEIRAHETDLRILVRSKLREEGTEAFRRLILSKPTSDISFSTVEEQIISKVTQLAEEMCVRYHHGASKVTANIHRFLHASLNLDRVLECQRSEDVDISLNHLHIELDSYYDEAWQRATDDHTQLRCQRAKLILMWATLAKQPLTVAALREALLASGGGVKNDVLGEEEIESYCAGLIRVEPLPPRRFSSKKVEAASGSIEGGPPSDSVVAFRHVSAHHYFERRQDTHFPSSGEAIVAACLLHSSPADTLSALPMCHILSTE